MATFDQTFPGFITACSSLYSQLLPWAGALLLIAFIFEFLGGPPSAFGMFKFILKLFLVVMVLANSNSFITSGQSFVQQWVQQNIPARPENVAARYSQQLAQAQDAPESNTSFWSTLFSSNWFEAIIYAVLTLLSWVAMAIMYFVYAVQHAVLLTCWAMSPLLFPLLAIRPLSHLGLRHVLRILAIMLWPLGNALAATVTDGLISAAVNQSFLASHSVAGSLGYGLQNLLAIMVITIWIIFSTILAPAFIQKMVVGSPGSAAAISQTVASLFSIGAPAVGGALAWGMQTAREYSAPAAAASAGQDDFSSSFSIEGEPNNSADWQPTTEDPTGDDKVRGIVAKLKKE
jgi:hypothetical protein